jgi:hypothetical protein
MKERKRGNLLGRDGQRLKAILRGIRLVRSGAGRLNKLGFFGMFPLKKVEGFYN